MDANTDLKSWLSKRSIVENVYLGCYRRISFYILTKIKMRKDIDYWDIIFNRCEWCKDHQLGDERTFENYMRLTRIINSMDDE